MTISKAPKHFVVIAQDSSVTNGIYNFDKPLAKLPVASTDWNIWLNFSLEDKIVSVHCKPEKPQAD